MKMKEYLKLVLEVLKEVLKVLQLANCALCYAFLKHFLQFHLYSNNSKKLVLYTLDKLVIV